MDVIPSVSSASWRFLCEYDCQRWQSSLASGYSSCAIDGYDEAPSCSSFAPGSFDIDIIFHVHCTKPVWCVTLGTRHHDIIDCHGVTDPGGPQQSDRCHHPSTWGCPIIQSCSHASPSGSWHCQFLKLSAHKTATHISVDLVIVLLRVDVTCYMSHVTVMCHTICCI